eukprot:gnl/TRDRNA2_/TRDRNA2_161025_c5_seq2.p2 gnl/TRDRNA2_/TRDRNA2_161025_c5~~gnl/TRDRNA2_/TRDRNA2_161025_c5_seq2.p2  ORF type:complete len:127 (-),score=23.55 gnl/TRDRNA2_/TRDRNA2_161025_c5_seq2:49-429(-)
MLRGFAYAEYSLQLAEGDTPVSGDAVECGRSASSTEWLSEAPSCASELGPAKDVSVAVRTILGLICEKTHARASLRERCSSVKGTVAMYVTTVPGVGVFVALRQFQALLPQVELALAFSGELLPGA